MLLTVPARRTAAGRAGFHSVGISTDISDPELVAFQDHLDTILYSDYILCFKYLFREKILCTTIILRCSLGVRTIWSDDFHRAGDLCAMLKR